MPKQRLGNCLDDQKDIPTRVLEAIPKSQRVSVPVRHKCAGCAYNAGVKEGIRLAQKALGLLGKSKPGVSMSVK